MTGVAAAAPSPTAGAVGFVASTGAAAAALAAGAGADGGDAASAVVVLDPLPGETGTEAVAASDGATYAAERVCTTGGAAAGRSVIAIGVAGMELKAGSERGARGGRTSAGLAMACGAAVSAWFGECPREPCVVAGTDAETAESVVAGALLVLSGVVVAGCASGAVDAAAADACA